MFSPCRPPLVFEFALVTECSLRSQPDRADDLHESVRSDHPDDPLPVLPFEIYDRHPMLKDEGDYG